MDLDQLQALARQYLEEGGELPEVGLFQVSYPKWFYGWGSSFTLNVA